jgi:hypothetical protein
MTYAENELQAWKSEQLTYFRNYLRLFRKDSEEYRVLTSGIEALRSGL